MAIQTKPRPLLLIDKSSRSLASNKRLGYGYPNQAQTAPAGLTNPADLWQVVKGLDMTIQAEPRPLLLD